MSNSATKSVTRKSDLDTGMDNKDSAAIAHALGKALADTYTLYLKTLGVHWNVSGPTFYSLHQLTEVQYEDMNAAVDSVAERIRALGQISPASFAEFAELSAIESSAIPDSAGEMLDALIVDNESLARRFREFVVIAEGANDVFTADMLTSRIGQHEENVWMLKAMRS